jgi:CheY-like chemotaxis protein
LLVEDTKTDEKLALLAIAASGVEVTATVARDGQEALDHLLRSADDSPLDPPDLVLLDLNLPKVSGLEVLRRARADARTRGVPIVMFTSAAEPAEVATCFDLGASAFVTKPTGFDELADAVKTTLLFWLKLHRQVRR